MHGDFMSRRSVFIEMRLLAKLPHFTPPAPFPASTFFYLPAHEKSSLVLESGRLSSYYTYRTREE
jgi:hypothetical protein